MDIDKDTGDWIINNSNNKNRRLPGLARQEEDGNMQQKVNSVPHVYLNNKKERFLITIKFENLEATKNGETIT
ncbi:hypothetical protein GJ496_008971 [Pomphorhynchus laevis]|nr:hypothetical protein GJ496_008971 [Pomphorhynchus laevis]